MPRTTVGFFVMIPTFLSGMQNTDEAAYVTLGAVKQYLSGTDALSIVNVQAASQDGMDSVKNGVENLLMSRHNINDTANADFSVLSMAELANLSTPSHPCSRWCWDRSPASRFWWAASGS